MNAADPMTHEEASELLPWAANQTLPREVCEAVLGHSLGCVTCRRELHDLSAFVAGMTSNSHAISVPAPDMRRINQRIDTYIERQGRGARILARVINFFSDPWHAAVAVQSTLLVFFAVLYLAPQPQENAFKTLSAPSLPLQGNHIRAVFGPDLAQSEISGLLQKFDLVAINGPSARGVYTLAYNGSDPLENEATAAALRQDKRVLFAQALGSRTEP